MIVREGVGEASSVLWSESRPHRRRVYRRGERVRVLLDGRPEVVRSALVRGPVRTLVYAATRDDRAYGQLALLRVLVDGEARERLVAVERIVSVQEREPPEAAGRG